MIRPLGNNILVERIEGHGIEQTLPSGIVIPATAQASVKTKADMFRSRVLAIGPEADRLLQGDLRVGDEVLLYTYDAHADRVFTGTQAGEHGLFIKPDDILCVVGGDELAPWRQVVQEAFAS